MSKELNKVLLVVTVETQCNETKDFVFTDNETASKFIEFAKKQEDVFDCYVETVVDDLETQEEELSTWLESFN